MANDYVKIENAIYDQLSAEAEDGEGGIYRTHEFFPGEMCKTALTEATGINFRDGRNRLVLENLVSSGLVTRRMSGKIGFYSLPEDIGHDEFFSRKAQARWKFIQERTTGTWQFGLPEPSAYDSAYDEKSAWTLACRTYGVSSKPSELLASRQDHTVKAAIKVVVFVMAYLSSTGRPQDKTEADTLWLRVRKQMSIVRPGISLELVGQADA